jgi:hypothetical protein
MNPKLPIHCPACEAALKVAQLLCDSCSTVVSGNYSMPVFLKLQAEEQDFILKFLLNSGSLKEMAKQMNLSYPTIRNKLDDLIEKIKLLQTNEDPTL